MLDFYSGLSSSLKASLIVTLALAIIVYILGKKVASMDPKAPIKGPMVIVVMAVDMLNDFVEEFYGSQWRRFAPILLTFLLFLALANTASLFGLSTPLSNINVALGFSFLAFGIIQVSGVIVRGPIQRIKDLSSPNPALLPLNLLGELSAPLAMGLRLFGNLLSGTVIGIVVFNLLNNALSVFATAFVIHPIFNIGFGLIQAFVYFMLLLVFLSMAIEEPEV
ncbi:MAG: F0F1 ATP synthase subunit A [Bacillota bacterium]